MALRLILLLASAGILCAENPPAAPEGMVFIPGGTYKMGSENGPPDEAPVHEVTVKPFFMDKTEVTNEQWTAFAKATGYVTIAERPPSADDFPGAPPENLVAGAVVFSPPGPPVPLNDHLQWWSYVKRANWRHPEGPDSSIAGREQYHVV